MTFFHICLDAVGYVLLEVVVEEAVVVEVIALRTEECCTVSRDAVELGIDGGDDDGTADGVNAGVGNTWDDELAFNGQRTEVLLDGCTRFLTCAFTLFGLCSYQIRVILLSLNVLQEILPLLCHYLAPTLPLLCPY